ncbi:DUF3800 domain-containing protein [Frondihabitans sp. 4ASC-45]|uniref:DUF3800 domain-containing protein n=1 Tax=Frondihabitans sp. 4ASC-45 TaxID=3111636 RepID=UPI003C25C467
MPSRYIVYVDESGDHSLTSIDDDYPIFVLAFCIFRVTEYVQEIVPAVQAIKFDFFDHDMVILHEKEIRKAEPPFDILLRPDVRKEFLTRIDSVFDLPFKVVATAIRKHPFKARNGVDTNPYDVALEFGLERVFLELQSRGASREQTVVVFESRGKKEDRDLELEFRRIMDNTGMKGMPTAFTFRVASKQTNSAGLQIADMLARPVGLHLLRPEQRNHAWERIEPHLRRSPTGNVHGWGLKVYP